MAFRLGQFSHETWRGGGFWNATLLGVNRVPNALWFAVDTGRRTGKMICLADFDPGVAKTIQERISGDEAIYVVRETSLMNWPAGRGRNLDGAIDRCELFVPLDDLAGMDGYLITPGRVVLVNAVPSLGFDQPVRFDRPDAVLALFADV